jgi:hypothetical protein
VASGGGLGEKLVGEVLLEDSYPSSLLDGSSQRQLTKEEQLLRERKRCSFNGITSFCLDQNRRRLVFSENSDLFYFDDSGAGNSSTEQNISTASKGPFLFLNIPSILFRSSIIDFFYVSNTD